MNNKKDYNKLKLLLVILILVFVGCLTIKSNTMTKKQYVHFSIDDTIEIFNDITKNNYETIFENETLRFLKECNNLYGTKFSLYCFYEYNGFYLSDCTDRYTKEFEQNSDWLKFGFHGLNSGRDYSVLTTKEAKEDYELVINQLKRIVGEKSITTIIRTEKFLCNKENAEELTNTEFGITGLLGLDTIDRPNYYLDETLKKRVFEEDIYSDDEMGINIFKTDIRVEKIKNTYQEIKKMTNEEIIIIFTHEWALNEENKEKIKSISNIINKNNATYDFLRIKLGGINEKEKVAN